MLLRARGVRLWCEMRLRLERGRAPLKQVGAHAGVLSWACGEGFLARAPAGVLRTHPLSAPTCPPPCARQFEDVRAFLSMWFHGAPFEQLRRGNVAELLAYAFFYRKVAALRGFSGGHGGRGGIGGAAGGGAGVLGGGARSCAGHAARRAAPTRATAAHKGAERCRS